MAAHGNKKKRKIIAGRLMLAVFTVALSLPLAQAGDDMRALLELLLEKGVITKEEFDTSLKKVTALAEIKEFNQAQSMPIHGLRASSIKLPMT